MVRKTPGLTLLNTQYLDVSTPWFIPEKPSYVSPFLIYDPSKVEEVLVKSCNIIADHYNLDFTYFYIFKEQEVLKQSWYSKILCLVFLTKDRTLEFRFNVPILDMLSNGSFYIKGYEQFVVKGLRETLWDTKTTTMVKCRLIDYGTDPFIDNKTLSFGCRVKIGDVLTILRYLLTKEPNQIDDSKYGKIVVEQVQRLQEPMSKTEIQDFEKREAVQLFFTASRILYDISDVAKLYCSNFFDFIVKTALVALEEKPLDELSESETGLSLIHKKVVNEVEILSQGALRDIINFLMVELRKHLKKGGSAKGSSSSETKRTIKTLDPSIYVYEYIQYEDFVSPCAFNANIRKVRICGSAFCFLSRDVRDSVRDVHPTHLYNLCPISTSDKENTGINLWLVDDVELDDYGRFVNLLELEQKKLNYIFENNLEKLVNALARQR